MKKTEKKMKKTNEAEFKSFDNLDLSKIKGSVSEILTTNFEKFNDCKTAEDVINLCHELFDEAGLKTEWTNKFFYQLDQIVKNNLNPRRAYQQAMLYVNNVRMKGAGLGMDRGKRIGRMYEDDVIETKSGKKYTKKQICEAIEYWEKQLKKMDESRNFDSMAMSVLPAKTESNMKKILGHIYSFIKQINEEYDDEFDIKYFKDFAKDLMNYFNKK